MNPYHYTKVHTHMLPPVTISRIDSLEVKYVWFEFFIYMVCHIKFEIYGSFIINGIYLRVIDAN